MFIVAALLCAAAGCGVEITSDPSKPLFVDNRPPTRWRQVAKEVTREGWVIYTLRDSADNRCFAVLDSRSYAPLGPVPCPPSSPAAPGALHTAVAP